MAQPELQQANAFAAVRTRIVGQAQPHHSLPIFALTYCALLLSHLPFLHLPYYWDEAGYFVPAALDLYRYGLLIPRSTLANGHPPLVAMWLAGCWHVFGVSSLATRAAMLVFAALLIAGVARLGALIFDRRTGWIAGLLTFFAPLIFAAAPMALLDLPSAALGVWALVFFFDRKLAAYAAIAAAACLTKESAVLLPASLFAFGIFQSRRQIAGWPRRTRELAIHAAPVIALGAWLAYYHAHTGYWFGNRDFLAYNLAGTLSGRRILIALGLRLWHLLSYQGTALLTCLAAYRLWRSRGRAQTFEISEKRREWVALVFVIAAYVVFHAVIGGAVLARYLTLALALYFVVVAAALSRLPHTAWIVAVLCVWLAVNWYWNPAYAFPYEDNLAWTTFVRLHVRAAERLSAMPQAWPVLTAWPATDELHNPDLGYVRRAVPVIKVQDFTTASLAGVASQPAAYGSALLFSREYQPEVDWATRVTLWARWKSSYFGHRPQPADAELLRALGLRSVFRQAAHGQWIDIAVAPDQSRNK